MCQTWIQGAKYKDLTDMLKLFRRRDLIFTQMAGGVTGYTVESTMTPDALTFRESVSSKPALIASYKQMELVPLMKMVAVLLRGYCCTCVH